MAVKITQLNTLPIQIETFTDIPVKIAEGIQVPDKLSELSYIEFFIYDLNKNIISSDLNFNNYSIVNNGQFPDTGLISSIEIDIEQEVINQGIFQGEYIFYFNFFNYKVGSPTSLYTVKEISSDRTELRIASSNIGDASKFIQERENSNYFIDFYLNFGNNQLLLGTNIIQDDNSILIKLYNPLPNNINLGSTLWIVTQFSQPLSYNVLLEDEFFIGDIDNTIKISPPNFNIPLKDQVNNSTADLSYNDIVNNQYTSSFNQISSLLEEKEIDINIDYTNFNNFIHFSSAKTRIYNFYYKMSLIEDYSSSIAILNNTTNSPENIINSISVYENKINKIITNFDGYDYYLYYSSESLAWPKTNNQPPYNLASINSNEVLTWLGSDDPLSPYYGGIISSASLFDEFNPNNLYYSIPEYLRSDSDNDSYIIFIDMMGQFYDNIWIYYKDVTEKYNADNRLEYGVSKDIVADAIRDFGIKLYQNNFSNDDLYTAFLGLTPQGSLFPFPNITGSLPTPSGYEYIEYFISASNDYLPLDDVNKSLYKRIYHNLPYLLKSKGTLPGLRALITSYGIPDTVLRINEYGGKDKINSNDWDYWQNEFNYAFSTLNSNFISSSWSLNSAWNAPNDTPATLMFRFKTEGLPTSSIPLLQSLWYGDSGSAITLAYTGSAYNSGSYSGSIIDPYYQYATLTFYPDTNNSSQTASIYLPFFDGGWWSVMVTKDNDLYTLYSQNKIYEGGDNGTLLGFKSSSSLNNTSSNWVNTTTSYFPVSFSISPTNGYNVSQYDVNVYNGTGNLSGTYTAFSGSYQEIRYYTVPISESVFTDYTMNPHSIEGNSLNSAPNELAFRASIGGEQYTASLSIHPKVTGSWITTHSFAFDSNFYYDASPNFIPNVEYTFADQPIAGIRNTISDKIRIENNSMPGGDVLSPFRSLSQNANISQSYTQNINYLEVAFSPTNEINEDITDQLGYFNLGDYIGDPRLRSSSAVTYPALDNLRNEYFQKYTKNYNLTDYIRLIKFFDNSLFKMIKDFVPARTSLASGIVIKQHLLERNKYPQPQMSWEDLDISGTLKPTWNNYNPGTVENFSGGTGGTFEQFNTLTNISQSWYESISTPSGSVLVLHNSQDEFYNGEFSGSALITNGVLNEAYSISNNVFNYKHVYYYGINQSQTDTFQNNFLNSLTSPSPGEILFFNYKFKGYLSNPVLNEYDTTFIKISKVDCNGNNNSLVLGQITKLFIYNPNQAIIYPSNYSLNFDEYNVSILNESSEYYLYQTNRPWGILTAIGPIADPHDNQVFDYTISSSITSPYNLSVGQIKTITNWNTTQIGTNLPHYGTPYFNTSSGILTFENTPNVPILITASLSITSNDPTPSIITSGSEFVLLRNGVITPIQSFPLDTNITNNYTFSASLYPIQDDKYYFRVKRDGIFSIYTVTVNNAEFYLYQLWNNFILDTFYGPSTSSCSPTIFEPYITSPNFYNSDENALLNNAESPRKNSYYMDVDYTPGILNPSNFNLIISGSATKASIPDSNYTSKRHTIIRYEGSKSTSQKLNSWTLGDTGTFGKIPTVESLKAYVAYGYMDGSWAPEKMNASVFRIKYLIDINGNIITPNLSENSLPTGITQQNFQTGERFKYSSITGTSGGGGTGNQYRNIIRGGYRIEPILYTQIGNAPNATFSGSIQLVDFDLSNGGVSADKSQTYLSPSTYYTPSLNTYFTLPLTVNNLPVNVPNSGLPLYGYTVQNATIQDGCNLTFKLSGRITTFPAPGTDVYFQIYKNSISPFNLVEEIILDLSNSNPSNIPYQITPPGGTTYLKPYVEKTIPNSDLVAGDTYFGVFFAQGSVNPANIGFISLKVSQYPAYPSPVSSSGYNTIWGWPDPNNYPYIITSSQLTLSNFYGDPTIKMSDITGSGFNPVTLPWSIKYGDEFRFEGREDFTYAVKKIFGPAEDGEGRIFETGSIEVHFSQNLPTSASANVFNLDHFLIRRYVEDSSQIIFEGYRPEGAAYPNSFIITPEYIIPELDKSVDEYVKLLTEKGLIG